MTATTSTAALTGEPLEAARRALLKEAARRARVFAEDASFLAHLAPWEPFDDDGPTNNAFFGAKELREALDALNVIGWPGIK
jgi:hypothetical protein